MLNRAYDSIMMAMAIPQHTASGSQDFNTSTIADRYCNAKSTSGTIRNMFHSSYVNGTPVLGQITNLASPYLPFSSWNYNWGSGIFGSILSPMEADRTLDYEDYSMDNVSGSSLPTGWKIATSSNDVCSMSYNSTLDTMEATSYFMWQNNTSSSKTVYGVYVSGNYHYRNNYSASSISSSYSDRFLFAEEKYSSPIVVPAYGIVRLSLTYHVGRAGKVMNLSAGGS